MDPDMLHTRLTSLALVLLSLLALSPLAASDAAASDEAASGEIADLFALRLVTPSGDEVYDEVRVLVQAYHPYTGAPIAGVEVRGLVDDDENEIAIGPLTTDENGEVEIVRSAAKLSGYVSVDIEATWRGGRREVTDSVYLYDDEHVLLGTDRKLYRPGQTVHVRGLWLDARRRPLAGEDVEVGILDPEWDDVAAVDLVTSAYGVAAFDWEIPETAPPGNYTIDAWPSAGWWSRTRIRVAPFEPAPFLVKATPSPFALPGTETTIEVLVTTPAGDPLAGVEERPYVTDGPLAKSRGPARTDADGQLLCASTSLRRFSTTSTS